MVESVFKSKSGIIINVDASAKTFIYPKNIIFGLLLHVAVKLKKDLASFIYDLLIKRDGMI